MYVRTTHFIIIFSTLYLHTERASLNDCSPFLQSPFAAPSASAAPPAAASAALPARVQPGGRAGHPLRRVPPQRPRLRRRLQQQDAQGLPGRERNQLSHAGEFGHEREDSD